MRPGMGRRASVPLFGIRQVQNSLGHGARKSQGPRFGPPESVRLANAGNVAASIFLSKNLLGYKDYFNSEVTGAAGGPIQVVSKPDFSQLSHEELKLLR